MSEIEHRECSDDECGLCAGCHTLWPCLPSQLAAAVAQRDEYRVALEWYANPSSHVENDGGARARAALEAGDER